jgi:phosphoenolpyruvate carboxykinase (ATP)
MSTDTPKSSHGLENHGILNTGSVHWNYPTSRLYEEIVKNNEGQIAHLGPICVKTVPHTGRAAQDKFIVEEETTKADVWWGKVNKPFAEDKFEALLKRMQSYVQGRELYVQDCFAGYDSRYRLSIRVINEMAWHNLFARTMFIQAKPEELATHKPEFTVFQLPRFKAIPEIDGTRSETFILLNFKKRMAIIGGSHYGGEIKKSIFTVLNYLLPKKNVMSMHCSANVGDKGDVAIFFGLSGTGKTTLSADTKRGLIGDDEHGWSNDGVFNYEGGCYAKVINLSKEAEPQIFQTTRMFGTIIENVAFNPSSRRLDLNDATITENTRAAYPLSYIPNALEESMAGHPKNIIMLTCDAFGVLPPISRLTPEQAMYHFISGYTAKVAGTEAGVKEPSATFSTCFGAPFMVLHPYRYAQLLADKMKEHKSDCWLVNTGWSGGEYGVGKRMSIKYTRALLNAAIDGSLGKGSFMIDPVFGIQVPTACPGVPSEILTPRNTWPDKDAYDAKAQHLAKLFTDNFKEYADKVPEAVRNAGPRAAVAVK